jgi:hypothetical protein
VFDNRVVKGTFGAKRKQIKGEKREIYNEECNDLYCSKNFFLAIKSRKR